MSFEWSIKNNNNIVKKRWYAPISWRRNEVEWNEIHFTKRELISTV